jgi:O-antigen/teichoic acid export membrane protein
MRNLTATVARNSIFGIIGQLMLKVVSFLFMVMVVRRLGDTSYGKYSVVLAFVGIFAIFSDLGISPFALREIAKDRHKTPSLFWNIFLLRLVLSVLVIVVTVVVAVMLNYSQDMVVGIFIASLGLCLYAIQGPLDVVLRAYERVDYSSVFSVTNQIVFVVVGTIMLAWGKGFVGLIIASFVGVIVVSVLSVVVIVRKFGWITFAANMRTWPSLLRAGLPFGVMELMDIIIMRMDVLILSYFKGDAAVGHYSAAYNNLILNLVLISQGFSTALFPSLSRQYATAPEKVPFIYRRAMKYLFMLALPITVGGTILSNELVVFLYDREFAPAVPVLQVLVWGLPIMFINSLSNNLARVMGRERYSARVATVGAVVNVALNLLLIPTHGLLGSAMAKVITEIVSMAQYFFILRREIFDLDVSDYLKPIIAASIMGVGVFLGKSLTISWLLLVGLGAVVYGALLVLGKAIGLAELRAIGVAVRKPKEFIG